MSIAKPIIPLKLSSLSAIENTILETSLEIVAIVRAQFPENITLAKSILHESLLMLEHQSNIKSL